MTKSTRLSTVKQEQIRELLSQELTYYIVARHLDGHISTVTRFVIRKEKMNQALNVTPTKSCQYVCKEG